LGRNKRFAHPDEHVDYQPALFKTERDTFRKFPPLVRTGLEIDHNILRAGEDLGIDLEFSPRTKVPTILGLSTEKVCGAVKWDPVLARDTYDTCLRKGHQLYAHSMVEADKDIFDTALGIKTPLYMWEDSMILHYLCNADFTQIDAKEQDEADAGSLGLMNLWTMASMYTDLPFWKDCLESRCTGDICYKHDQIGYCAVDSYAGLVGGKKLMGELKALKIPYQLYREIIELSECCHVMREKGIYVDRKFVQMMEKGADEIKEGLFPSEKEGRRRVFKEFNPKSVKEIQGWFAAKGVELEKTDKKYLYKKLEREARKAGVGLEALLDDQIENPAEALDALARLYRYKNAGKGLSAWFDEKYTDQWGFIHPRFITVGTCTGRLSSAKPNFQNVPRVGFGSLVRRAIIPRDAGNCLLKVDFSQLELRKCLHSAGYDRQMARDAFADLVVASEGKFEKAAKLYSLTPRDIAKSVSHAGNYGEGFKLLTSGDLESKAVKSAIREGALLVFKDWEYCGGVVGFTGANLAKRLFGDENFASRRKALEIQEIYFSTFPIIRQWQQKVSETAERGEIRSSTGRYLRLHGDPSDRFKQALAFLGQGEGADHVQAMMLKFHREPVHDLILQVHDELVFEGPKETVKDWGRQIVEVMEGETWRLPGFRCPVNASYGDSWLEKIPKGMEAKAAELGIVPMEKLLCH